MVPLVASLSQSIPGAEWLVSEKGDLRLRIPAGQQPLKFTLSLANAETNENIGPLVEQLLADDSAIDLTPLTQGGPPRWPGTLALEGTIGTDDGPFAVDVLTHPETNPWFCRVRPTGFDFLPDGNRAAVCCWDGDVWMVTGIDRPQDGLTWQRIASGMFQPLGLKYLNGKIYVACRDQIAILHDFNGDGMVYVVPHERVDGIMQGGMVRLLDKPFPTGIMRGRFHPGNGQLYLCGMFAWAGSATQPGGFYRLRYTGKPLHMPIGLHATHDGMHITFTDPLDRTTAENPANYSVMIWSLKRTATYGSDHINERPLQVTAATLSPDGKTVSLRIPNIQPTWCMAIRYRLKSADGIPVERVIHNTVHRLRN